MTYPARRFAPKTVRQDWNAVRQELEQVSDSIGIRNLLAMAPNLSIRLHIVAPIARREKVFSEIKRPVFSLLEGHALSEICSFLSYDSVLDLHEHQHLEYLPDRVLDDYEEKAEEED